MPCCWCYASPFGLPVRCLPSGRASLLLRTQLLENGLSCQYSGRNRKVGGMAPPSNGRLLFNKDYLLVIVAFQHDDWLTAC